MFDRLHDIFKNFKKVSLFSIKTHKDKILRDMRVGML